MRETLLAVLLMLLVSVGLPVRAEQPKAMIKGTTYEWLDTETVPCGVLFESQLRRLGFQIIERTRSESEAGVVVSTAAACTGIIPPGSMGRTPMMRMPNSQCIVQGVVRGPAVRNFAIRGKGNSNTGHLQALSAACRQAAERMVRRLGGSGNLDIKKRPRSKDTRFRLRVVFRWEGRIEPMPLVTATRFFKRAGYEAKLTKGGAQRCIFQVVIEEDRKRFIHLLKTYLRSKYAVEFVKNAGAGVVFRLSPRLE